MKKLCIGLAGKPGSGKDTVVELLAELATTDQNIGHYRFSDILYKMIEVLAPLEKNRENAQNLAIGIKNHLGADVLTNALKERAQNDKHDVVILNGVRWLPDEKMLRELPNNILIYVFANPEIRFTRLKDRKQKTNEEFMTWEQFLREDDAENERFIEEIGSRADFSFNNNGSREDLRNQVYEFCRKRV